MRSNRIRLVCSILIIATIVFTACAPTPVPAPAADEPAQADASTESGEGTAAGASGSDSGSIQIPEIAEDMFNVAFVYVGTIGDGGWTYAHNEGREYLQETLSDTVNTVYLESVPEGADAERVIRNLARQGFDAIFTT